MKRKALGKIRAQGVLAVLGAFGLVFASLGALACNDVAEAPESGAPKEPPQFKVSFAINPPEVGAQVVRKHNNVASTASPIMAFEGDTVSFEITEAARGYLQSVTIGEEEITEFPHTITVGTANIGVNVNFVMEKHAVSVLPSEGAGSTQVKPSEAYPLQTVTLTLTPAATTDDTNWFLESLTITQTGAEAGASEVTPTTKVSDKVYSFVMPNYDVDVAYNFSRTISSNTELATLVPSAGSLDKTFSSAQRAYVVTVGPEVASLDFTYTTVQPDAQPVLAVDDSRLLLPLQAGITTARITITAQDEETQGEYVIEIRKNPSADLSTFKVSGADFSGNPFIFNQPTVGVPLNVELPTRDDSTYDHNLTLTLTPRYPTTPTVFEYSGTGVLASVSTATSTQEIQINEGADVSGTITVKATADGLEEEKTYTLNLRRNGVPNTGTTALTITGADEEVVYYSPEINSWCRAYIFTASGTMTVAGSGAALLFAVGGGQGGGGTGKGGGGTTRGYGGAGGTVVQQTATLVAGEYVVTIGAGGAGGPQTAVATNYSEGVAGSATTISGTDVDISAAGGTGTVQTGVQSAVMPNGPGCGSYGYSGQMVDYGYANAGNPAANNWNKEPLANSGQGGGTRTNNYSGNTGVGIPGAAGVVIVRVPIIVTE